MSELAFNANGEAFDVPANVTAWRVRRMKPRGAPELVYGSDGRPLTVPIEATIDELRDAVGSAGKYRLDPVNDDGKCVEAVPPAYVQVVRQPRNADAAPANAVTSASDDTLREAMRLNTELAKSIVDKFPEVMHAAAELLRAADGAGMPSRQPRDEDDEDDDDDEDEEIAEVKPGFDIADIAAKVIPPLVMAFTSGDKSRLPSFAEMLDWRKAVPKTKPSEAKPSSGASKPSTEPATSASPIDGMAKVGAVLDQLTPDERMLAVALAQELPADERAKWYAELAPLSIDDAVARVRKILSSTKSAGSAS